MKFLDFFVGQTIRSKPYLVSEQEILTFAKAYDQQWFHTNPQAAAKGPFKGLIASGWHTCSIAMHLIAAGPLADSDSFASPGVQDIRWHAPVRPGDELTLTATILEARRSSSNPQRGILRWRWQLHNQDGIETLNLVATSFFNLQEQDADLETELELQEAV
jgi:acyl dehydratase